MRKTIVHTHKGKVVVECKTNNGGKSTLELDDTKELGVQLHSKACTTKTQRDNQIG